MHDLLRADQQEDRSARGGGQEERAGGGQLDRGGGGATQAGAPAPRQPLGQDRSVRTGEDAGAVQDLLLQNEEETPARQNRS